MKSTFFLKLILSVICTLACGITFAKINVTDLKPLFSDNFDAKVRVVQNLSKEGSPEALQILESLSAESLFLSPQGVVIQKGINIPMPLLDKIFRLRLMNCKM